MILVDAKAAELGAEVARAIGVALLREDCRPLMRVVETWLTCLANGTITEAQAMGLLRSVR